MQAPALRVGKASDMAPAYTSRPQWKIYAGLLRMARMVHDDLHNMQPRDMIDLQSYLWVQGSDEYPA